MTKAKHLVHISQPEGLPEPAGYSHVVTCTGRLVIVSGQLPISHNGELVGTDGLTQARQVFHNIGRALNAAGAHQSDIVRLGFYLTDLGDLPAVRAARDEFLGTDDPPASSLIQVVGLVLPGARVEIDAIALVGE